MRLYYDFQINGRPIVPPDAGLTLNKADLDAEDSGRDESGYMHRVILRKDMKTFGLQYSSLTREEYQYMLSLINTDEGFFEVKYLDESRRIAKMKAYCSNHSISIFNVRTGLYKNLKFNIIEC